MEDQSIIDEAILAQSNKSEFDEMEHNVADFLEEKTLVTSIDIWIEVFGGRKDSFEKSTQMRIAKILKKLGFKKNNKDKSWAR